MADEIRTIENVRTVNEPQWRQRRESALNQEAWVHHRTSLARELSDDGWRAVADVYDALSQPPMSARGEEYVTAKYDAAMKALRPLQSSETRYWWQRLRRLRFKATA